MSANLLGFLDTERVIRIGSLVDELTESKYTNIWRRHLAFQRSATLRQMGMGYGTIARELKVSKGQIVNWLRGRYIPLRRHVVPMVGPDMAYVLGAWLGDGSLARYKKRWRHYTKLAVTDMDFASAFAVSVGACLARQKPPRLSRRKDGRFEVVVNNRILYDFLACSRVSLELAEPIVAAYPGIFLRGFWDAEGTVDLTRSQNKIQACNTNERIIRLVKAALDLVGIHYTVYSKMKERILLAPRSRKIYYRRHRIIYTINVRRCCHLKFQDKVGFAIRRKSERLRIVTTNPIRREYCPLA